MHQSYISVVPSRTYLERSRIRGTVAERFLRFQCLRAVLLIGHVVLKRRQKKRPEPTALRAGDLEHAFLYDASEESLCEVLGILGDMASSS